MPPSFSGALLAGGQSRRMGRDKALLPTSGFEFLWQRQIAILQQTNPHQIYWSGSTRPGLPPEITVVPDVVPDAGPLAGIASCLELLDRDILLVLAIDLPEMTAEFFLRLLERCTRTTGAMARRENYFEPLAAAYPKALLPVMQQQLAQKKHALQDLARAGQEPGLIKTFDLASEDFSLFKNVNSPGDLQ